MKKLLLFSAILLGSVGLVSAQNDRRAKSAKTAKTVAPNVAKTEAEKKAHTADIIARKKADQASRTTVIAVKAN